MSWGTHHPTVDPWRSDILGVEASMAGMPDIPPWKEVPPFLVRMRQSEAHKGFGSR